MKYLSVCSGIEAATVAWHPLGWEPFGFSEIEPFPSAVLAHHYGSNMPGEAPAGNGVPNFGNMERYLEWPDAAIDLLVGGTPCQSFSVAGLRKGLADPRGNLALVYLGIVDRYRPDWFIWENVPGVLSSNGGRDFGALLGGFQQLRYGFAYRVLDAQYVRVDGFGRAVPQRRRRVFVVGNSRSWRRAAAVLFERESLSGNPAPRRETGKGVAPTISARTKGGDGLGTDFDCDGGLLAFGGNDCSGPIDVATARNAHGGPAGRLDFESETFITAPAVADTLTAYWDRSKGAKAGNQVGLINPIITAIQERAISENPDNGPDGIGVREDGAAYTLESRTVPQAVAFNVTPSNSNADFNAREADYAQALTRSGNRISARGGDIIAKDWAVRRLTPLECERLQGFPDGYTQVPFRKKPAADGPRYKACGNSMAVNVMRWLGRRIEIVRALEQHKDEP